MLFLPGICFIICLIPCLLNAAPGSYSVHIASYQSKTLAVADVKKLELSGNEAFYSEVDIKGKGHWYRVYAGRYKTRKKAVAAAKDMKNKQIISMTYIHYLPASLISTEKAPASRKEIAAGQKPARPDAKNELSKAKSFAELQKKFDEAREFTRKKKPETDRRRIKDSIKEAVRVTEPLALLDDRKPLIKSTVEPEIEEKEENASGSPLYDKAINEMKQKNYEQALLSFKELVERDDTSKELGERALRHMANCHFYLGEKGNKEHLLNAVEFYKNTLRSFPEPRKKNILSSFRLAKTYEILKYYPEAIKAYENFISLYPDSSYSVEAMFKTGDILYKTEKYNAAAERLIAYLIKYRGVDNAKQVFYMIADSYYRSSQSSSAELWYRDAQKKWPDLNDVPKSIVINMGQHKYSLRRFDEAISIFSLYVNYYPGDEKITEIYLLLANSYREAEQFSAALVTYAIIIDKYPKTKEAGESILAIASLGVNNPGIKGFASDSYIQYYRHPINAYDTILMQKPDAELAQQTLLKKANALGKLRNYSKAVETYLEFINLYPQSKIMDEARKGLRLVSGTIIDDFYRKKDYVAVADIYFKAYPSLPLKNDEYHIVSLIASSLKEIGLIDDYIKLLNDYKKVCTNQQTENIVTLDIAEAEIAAGRYDQAENKLLELAGRPTMKNNELMIQIKRNLAKISYRKGYYDKAIVNYAAFLSSAKEINEPGQTYYLYASALKKRNDNTLALQNYLSAAKYLKHDKKTAAPVDEVYKEMGDLYLNINNFKEGISVYKTAYESSQNPDLKYWLLFNMGQSYHKMENINEADKIFAQIKTEAGPEGFWAKVVDYYVDDNKWWDKYGAYLVK